MRTAVLFLIFNRPDTTRQAFEAIRQARPPLLYVAADGPRPDRPSERELCEKARSIATAVDWPCEVKTLFRDNNLGCKHAVSEGITWFFEHEEEGIILEDDVIPARSFFPYCKELLDRYRHEPRVAMVSGCNLVSSRYDCDDSYFFSIYNHVWGWASWRRAWSHYDVAMSRWPAMSQAGKLDKLSCGNRMFVRYWENMFYSTYRGEIDTWDYQWLFTLWDMGALAIIPAHNLAQNIGFGSHGTHTLYDTPKHVRESVIKEVSFPLRHPTKIHRSVEADSLITSMVYGINRTNAIKDRVHQIFSGPSFKVIKMMLQGNKRCPPGQSSGNSSEIT